MEPVADDREALYDTAADWVVRRDAGFSPAERGQFERWLAADARHPAALAEMTAALAVFTRPRELGHAATVIRGLSRWDRARRRRHRNVAAFATVVLAAAAAAVVAFRPTRDRPAQSAGSSENRIVLRSDRRVLADGSVVELNANAEVRVDFSPVKRSVRLVRGTAHFAVAQDAARLFVVAVGGVEVRAVGTEFAVRLATKEVDVLVTEGRVAVARAMPDAAPDNAVASVSEPVIVPAGARLAVPSDGSRVVPSHVEPITPAQIEAALAWRGMRLEFSGTPLAEAVALFNRKSQIRISLADASLSGLRISGIYWADNPEGFARLLEASLGIQAMRTTPNHIVLRSP